MTTMQTTEPLRHAGLEAHRSQIRVWVPRLVSGAVELSPPYQRGEVWTVDQQRLLFRSFLTGIPVPAVIVNDRCTEAWEAANGHNPLNDGKNMWAVIDGKQRLKAALDWQLGELALPASWFDPDHVVTTRHTGDGPYVTRADLTETGVRVMENRCTIPVAEARVATVAEEAAIFALVNRGGTEVTDQDMARAAEVATTS